jgi:hypothetical protein
MDRGEIASGGPEVLARALMDAGELIGLRWILWGDTDEIPPHVFEEAMRFFCSAAWALRDDDPWFEEVGWATTWGSI